MVFTPFPLKTKNACPFPDKRFPGTDQAKNPKIYF